MSDEESVEQHDGSSSTDRSGVTQRSAAISDTGHRRNNQDSFLVADELGLYVVADGVGGNQAGDVASATATRVIHDIVSQWRKQDSSSRDRASAVVHRAIETACATIHRAATEDRNLAGMSTTVTMVLVDGDTAAMGHVGDSRLYLVREGTLEQISTDHTLAAELYREGIIAREQVERHHHAHALTRNCGTQPSVKVESLIIEVHSGDLLLLCSDGLNPALRPPEHVVDTLESATDLTSALRQLAERAKQAGSRDNITAVVWRRDGGDPSLTRRTVDALRSVPLLGHLSMADLSHVAEQMEPREYDAGHVILERGDHNAALYVVLDGQLRWELPTGHFAHLERGKGIGSTTLVATRRSPAQLSAQSSARVLVLTSEKFRDLVRLRPRLGNALLIALADELSDWIDPDTDRGMALPPHGLLVEF